MLSYVRGWLHGTIAPRIIVTASTSTTELSWSGAGLAFSVTLEIAVEADVPITILPNHTLLETDKMALYEGGFTFTNIQTGGVARREIISDCRNCPTSYITADETVEIPKQSGSSRCVVTHTFNPPYPGGFFAGHSRGLEIGQTYDIGLGDKLSKVRWWKWGSKAEVFSFPFYRRGRYPSEVTPELQMMLVNRARITVVE
jgi:hypothetical protein